MQHASSYAIISATGYLREKRAAKAKKKRKSVKGRNACHGMVVHIQQQ